MALVEVIGEGHGLHVVGCIKDRYVGAVRVREPIGLHASRIERPLLLVVPQPEGAVWERPVVIRAGGVAAAVRDLHEFEPVIRSVLLEGPGDDRRSARRAVSLCHGNCPARVAGRPTNLEYTIPTSTWRGASR